MRVNLNRLFVTLLVTSASVAMLSADNWPQWRGPQLTGVSGEKGLPVKWSTSTGENIAWKLAMPSRSGATPIVWNDMVFLNIATSNAGKPGAPEGDVELWAVNRKSGETAWKKLIAGGNYRINKQNMS